MAIEIMHPPRALVLGTPGINRDNATKTAYEAAGGRADIVHINQLLDREVKLSDYQIFSIPGGFSYGDHIQSGVILALKFQQSVLSDQIYSHLEKGRLILGVCNGFQVLVQSGLLPFGQIHSRDQNVSSLTFNEPNQFRSEWVHLKPVDSNCLFVDSGDPVTFPIDHGEGRFVTDNNTTLLQLQQDKHIVYQYYEANPNGSEENIAAICDKSGQILGMMPHPEDFIIRENRPNWRRMDKNISVDGLEFFQNIVEVARDL